MENAEPSRTRPRPNSAAPTQGHRLFFLLSLSLNLGLLLFLILTYRKPAPETISPVPLPDNTTQASERIHVKRIPARASVLRWKSLESNDLAIYAANLRAGGCPTKTVRDILLPEIEEKFEHSESPVPEPNFWANFSQRQAAAAARTEQETTLRQQKDKMLEELLGFAWTSEGLKQAYVGEAAGSVGFLDYERAEKLLCMAQRFKKQFLNADSTHRIDHRAAIYQTWRQEVGEILSPAEFEETELREILMICQRHNPNLCQVGLSGSELRQLMAFRRDLHNPLPSALFAKSDEILQESDWAGEVQLHAKARLLLGDNRFIDYLKSCDASIDRTLATLEREQLPRSLALELFDLRQEAMARAQKIRELPVRRTEKRAHLTTLRQSALEQLAALPNAAIDINQDWLQEIANP